MWLSWIRAWAEPMTMGTDSAVLMSLVASRVMPLVRSRTGSPTITTIRALRHLYRRASRRAIRSATRQLASQRAKRPLAEGDLSVGRSVGASVAATSKRPGRVQQGLRAGRGAGAVDQNTVAQEHHLVGPGGMPGLVGHQQTARPRVTTRPQDTKYGLTGLRVK